jgi:hypothetical protein
LPKVATEINAADMPTHVVLSNETLTLPKAAEVIAALEHPALPETSCLVHGRWIGGEEGCDVIDRASGEKMRAYLGASVELKYICFGDLS